MKKYRILIADSTPSVRQYIRLALQEHFYTAEFEAANNGKNIQKRLESAHFDVVLYDRDMSMLNGDELLYWARRHDSLKNLPIILLSSDADESRFRKAAELGADGYLIKPLLQEPLVRKVREVLDRARQKAVARSQSSGTARDCNVVVLFGSHKRSGCIVNISSEEISFSLNGEGSLPVIFAEVSITIKVNGTLPVLSLQGQVTGMEGVNRTSAVREVICRAALIEELSQEKKHAMLKSIEALSAQSSAVAAALP
jgi:two-component system chemotaxis response regulator CheY